jgi:hypothetical protein
MGFHRRVAPVMVLFGLCRTCRPEMLPLLGTPISTPKNGEPPVDNAEREIHLRSVALVRHFARGDHSAVNLLLPDIVANRDTAWRQIVSLVGLCQAVLFDSSPDPAVHDDVMERALLGITAPDDDPSDA